MRLGNITTEVLTDHLRDDTEGLYGFRWQHFDLLQEFRANTCLAGVNETDFRLRARYQLEERLFLELMDRILPYLPDSEITGREGGEVWKEEQAYEAAQAAKAASEVLQPAAP